MMSSLPVQRGRFVGVLGFAFACALLASLSSSQTSQPDPPPASFAAPPLFSVAGPEVGPTGLWSMAKGDFNGDHKTDFVVAGFNCASGPANPADSIAVYTGNGDGSFQAPLFFQSPGNNNYQIAVADLNNDGKLDVITRTGLPETLYVSLGSGDGNFLPAYAIWSPPNTIYEAIASGMSSFTIGDFNNDGNLDIAADANGARVEILLGTGTGLFVPTASYVINQYQGGNGLGQITAEKLSDNGNVDLVVGTGYGATLVI